MSEGESPAELVLSDLHVTPDSVKPGEYVSIVATARNDGQTETGPFTALYRLERDDGSGAAQDYLSFPTILPIESHTEQWQVPLALHGGNFTFHVTLDVNNQVAEGNKNDNSGSGALEVGEAPSTPMATADNNADQGDQLSGQQVNVRKDEGDVIEAGHLVHINIGAGNTPQTEIVAQAGLLKEAIGNYWSHYSAGLRNFQTSMTFPPEQVSEANYLEATVKALLKQALDIGLGHLAVEIGEHGKEIVDAVKAVAEGLIEEGTKAGTTGKVRIADYIEDAADSIEKQRERMQAAIDFHPLLDRYHALTADWPGRGAADADGLLASPGAQFIINLRKSVADFVSTTPSPTAFQQRLTEAFADMPVQTGSGVPLQARLYFHLNLYNNGDNWEIKSKTDDHWTVVTSEPEPQGVAHSLQRSLHKEGKKPWQTELPKEVQIFIEVEESGSNTFADGHLLFAGDPDAFEVRTNYSASLFEKAWAHSDIKHRVLNTEQIEGSNG